MATKTLIRKNADGTKLEWVERVTGTVGFAFRVDDVHHALRDAVFEYGLKQILSDAAAGLKGADARNAL